LWRQNCTFCRRLMTSITQYSLKVRVIQALKSWEGFWWSIIVWINVKKLVTGQWSNVLPEKHIQTN
jgi:hypothetical protein